MQPLQKKKENWQFLKKLEISYHPEIQLLNIYPREFKSYMHTKTCTQIFLAALFIIAKAESNPVRCCCLVTKSCPTLLQPHVACQPPLSMGFFRQEYWSGLPFPFPGDLPDPGIESLSPESPELVGGFFTTGPFRHKKE